MKFESSFEKQKEIGKKEQIQHYITTLREKFPSLERVVKRGSDVIKILSIVAFLSSGEIMAHENKYSEDNELSLEHIETLFDKDLNTIHAELDHLKKSLSQPASVSLLEREEGDAIHREMQGTLSVDDGYIGDIGVSHTVRKIDREGEGVYENLFTNSVEVSSEYDESDIEGVGERIQETGVGKTKELAILDALEKLHDASSIDVFSTTVSSSLDGPDNFISVTAIDGCNYFEDVEIISESQSGEGDESMYEVVIKAEKGKFQIKQ